MSLTLKTGALATLFSGATLLSYYYSLANMASADETLIASGAVGATTAIAAELGAAIGDKILDSDAVLLAGALLGSIGGYCVATDIAEDVLRDLGTPPEAIEQTSEVKPVPIPAGLKLG